MWWIIAGLVFVAFFFATCVCCGCTQFEDLFTRSDSTSIGTDWTEEAGSWEINGNELRTTSTNSVAVYAYEPTTDSYTVNVEIDPSLGNGSFRIYSRQNALNYVCGEFYAVGASPGTNTKLRIISCVSGVETIVAQIYGASARWLRMCVDSEAGIVAVGVTSSETGDVSSVAVAQITPPGKQIAIGVGDTLHTDGFIDVESFSIKNYTSACPDCYFSCGDEWPAFEVQVEVDGLKNTGATCGSCTLLHGTYTLTLQGKGNTIGIGQPGTLVYALDIPGAACGIDAIALAAEDTVFGSNSSFRLYFQEGAWCDNVAFNNFDVDNLDISDPSIPNNNACYTGSNTVGITGVAGLNTICHWTSPSAVPCYVEVL